MRFRLTLATAIAALVAIGDTAHADPMIYAFGANNGTLYQFDTSGHQVGAGPLITGLNTPSSVAASDGNLFIASLYGNTISEYSSTGVLINPALISGLSLPLGMTIVGSTIYVSNYVNGASGTGFIGEYTTSGATVNAALITGLTAPAGIAVSGLNLYVSSYLGGTVGEYTTSGATVNASLITGLSNPNDLLFVGPDLFVGNNGSGTVGEYTASGMVVNASLISGQQNPGFLALLGSNLLVSTNCQGIKEYTTSGTAVADPLITGCYQNLTVADLSAGTNVPEPASLALLGAGVAALGLVRRRRAIRLAWFQSANYTATRISVCEKSSPLNNNGTPSAFASA